MVDVPNRNVPSLGGWIIAAGMGLVAFAVARMIGGFDWIPAVAIGAVVCLVAGLILGMGWGSAGDAAAVGPADTGLAVAATPAVAVSDDVVVASFPAAVTPVALTPGPAVVVVPAVAAKVQTPKAPAEPVAKPAAKAPAKPAAAKAVKAAGPEVLTTPRGGKADDLKQIEGIGPALEKLINSFGVHHFDQIANWTDEDIAFFDGKMGRFSGRITRDKWVAQARIIDQDGIEAFLERAKTNDY